MMGFKAQANALISECGLYRYVLTCNWIEGGKVNAIFFMMLNPSTADQHKDDATIRRCMSFAQNMGRNFLLVANLYAYRATNPDELKRVADPIGPNNGRCLSILTKLFPNVVCAWGRNAEKEQVAKFTTMCHQNQCTMQCFGVNKGGSPRHPLYVPKSALLREYVI